MLPTAVQTWLTGEDLQLGGPSQHREVYEILHMYLLMMSFRPEVYYYELCSESENCHITKETRMDNRTRGSHVHSPRSTQAGPRPTHR